MFLFCVILNVFFICRSAQSSHLDFVHRAHWNVCFDENGEGRWKMPESTWPRRKNRCLLQLRINMSQCAVKTRCTFISLASTFIFASYGSEWHHEIRNGPGNYKDIKSADRSIIQSSPLHHSSCWISAKRWRLNSPRRYTQSPFIGWLHFRCACFPPDFQMRVWFLSASDWRMSVLGEGKSSAWTFHLLYRPTCKNIDVWKTSQMSAAAQVDVIFLICLFLSSRWSLWKLALSSGPSLVVSPIFIW